MTIKNWNIEEMTGYTPITTYYQDFSIADKFGTNAIKDTYNRVKNELAEDYNGNYKEFTEFVMALNWKIWEHYQSNDTLAKLYNTLWEQADIIAQEQLTDDKLSYFYSTTD